MSTILSALLLAASLSSTDVGEFFTFPSWLPTSVGSHDTPGSDPSGGVGGWYVEEYTNAVSFTDWTVTANGQEVDVGYVLVFGNGQWYNIGVAGSLAYGIIYGSEHPVLDVTTDPEDIYGTGEELELAWVADVIHQADNPQGFDHAYLNMCATREIVLTPVPTGKWKPRAARLTPEVQAGVLSSFAGYCERQYYAGQGQTNDWNTSIWGPTFDKKKFLFNPGEREVTTVTTNFTPWEVHIRIHTNEFDRTLSLRYDSNRWYIDNVARCVVDYYFPGSYINYVRPEYLQGGYDILELETDNAVAYVGGGEGAGYYHFDFTATREMSVVTNNSYEGGYEFAYHPTNRTVSSRRLLEFENIKGLGDYLKGDFAEDGFVHRAANRPGWIEGVCDQRSAYSSKMWWSSTEGNVLSGTRIVPEFSGNRYATESNDWSDASQTFCCLSNDVSGVWGRGRMPPNHHPSVEMMSRLQFSPDFDASHCRPLTVNASVKDLIEKNFPHADGLAISNLTRRLCSERLCCMNQMMSLMDRTFTVPDVTYPTTGISVYHINEINYHGNAEVSEVTYDSSSESYLIGIAGINWDSGSNRHNVTTNIEEAFGTSISYRITPTLTYVGSTIGLDGEGWNFSASDEFVLFLLGHWGMTGEFYALFRCLDGLVDVNGNAYAKVYYSIGNSDFQHSDVYTVYIGSIDSIPISTYFNYSREYRYKRTLEGMTEFRIMQPGLQGWSRSSSRCGIVYGEHSSTNEIGSSSLLPINWTSASDLSYYSQENNYHSIDGLIGLLDIIADNSTYDDFKLLYGVSPDNWSAIIPIDMGDAQRTRDAARFKDVRLSFEAKENATYVLGSFDGDRLYDLIVWTEEGLESWEGYRTLGIATLGGAHSNTPPRQIDRPALSMDARIGIITRTDWNWKTLKRSAD